jgi:invasion protein IalB
MEKKIDMAHSKNLTRGIARLAVAAGTAATLGVMTLSGSVFAQDAGVGSWIKVCGEVQVPVPGKDGKVENKQTNLCQTLSEQVNPFGFTRISIQKADIVEQHRIEVQVPQGMSLRHGIRVTAGTEKECEDIRQTLGKVVKNEAAFPFIEKAIKAKATILPYRSCGGDGRQIPLICIGEGTAEKELIDRMRKASCLAVQSFSEIGIPPIWLVGLKDFAKAYDGKALTTAEYGEIIKKRNAQLAANVKKRSEAEMAKDPKLAEAYKKLKAAEQEMSKMLQTKKPPEKK